jgi:hypothetical protein
MPKAKSILLFLATLTLPLAAFVSSAAAQQRADSAAFIVRIGKDTSSIERYIRTADQLIVEAAQRSPSTIMHRLVLDIDAAHNTKRATYVVTRPGSPDPLVRRTMTFAGDSAVIETTQNGQTRTQRVAARNAVPLAGPFYTPYELAVMRAVAARTMKSSVPLLAGANIVDIPVEMIGRDSASLTNQFAEPMRMHIDNRGRLLHLHTPAYTTVERTRWIDLDRLANDFAARDATGKGMGMLSPRQTTRSTVNGANIWIDYSRPGMRGRPIWGALVPYGKVWRTGANDAAHIATDKTLDIGGLTVPPGTYTLFLLPTADEWTLVVNKQTGMSGLDYNAANDVGRVKLTKETIAQPAESFTIELNGNNLSFVWDRTRATVPITVR